MTNRSRVLEFLVERPRTHDEVLAVVPVTRRALHAMATQLRHRGLLAPAQPDGLLRLTGDIRTPAAAPRAVRSRAHAIILHAIDAGTELRSVWDVAVLLREALPSRFPDDTLAARELVVLSYMRAQGMLRRGWPLQRVTPITPAPEPTNG